MSRWEPYFGSIRQLRITVIVATILIFGFGALYLTSEDKLLLAAFVALVGVLACFVMYYNYKQQKTET
jgi:predicted neutral ceramidase superfamily lipid hydrolase